MRDFITEIKRINTDGIIFEFSKVSIEMYHNQQWQKSFDIMVTNCGITNKRYVSLSAWEIQHIAYLSVLYSNDHRRTHDLPSIGELVNLYRGYENKHSIAEGIKAADIDHLFRAVLGMTAEQFQYQNIRWIYEKLNRDYYILLAAKNFEHRPLIDVESIARELLGFSADEFIMVLLMIFGLCSRSPMPLERYSRISPSELPEVLSQENITKVISYYSCTYEDLRKSQLGKQLLYSKPFIKTKKDQLYIHCNMYLVAMLIGNGLYWLTRDYYRTKSQHFTNSFGLLFEDYIKDLASRYCKSSEWGVIPQGKKKGADFFFDIGSIRIIIESKSALLQLGAKQQAPDLDAVDKFFERHIAESFAQLNNSFAEMQPLTPRQVVKVTLLYDDFSNTSIIEKSMSEIFTYDSFCYVMTIRDLEILLNLHKFDSGKCIDVCNRIANNSTGIKERESIGAILEHMGLTNNPHWEGELDFFSKIMDLLQND